MSRPPFTDPPGRLVLDFDAPMRPRERGRVKIIPGPEKPPSGGSLAFAGRGKLYERLTRHDQDDDC